MNIKIEVLYPEFCNLYGDTGNILYLKEKLLRMGAEVDIMYTHYGETPFFAGDNALDFLYIGPCTESQQELIASELLKYSDKLKEKAENGLFVLATGNSFELFGEYIEKCSGEKISCLNWQPFYAKRFDRLRFNDNCVGNFGDIKITGFKNQLSHSYGEIKSPFITMLKGAGLNPQAKIEGISYNNLIATYLIGPILLLNPPLTAYILKGLLKEDYKEINLPFETQAYEQRISEIQAH